MILCIIDLFQFQLTTFFQFLILFLIVVCVSDGKTVVKLTEETQLILGEVTRQLNLEKLLPTYRYVVSVRWVWTFDIVDSLTHSLPIMPTATLGSNKGPPQLSVPSQPLGVAPAVAQAHHLCLYSASPFILGSAPLPPALWCPVECSLRKKVSLPPGDMTYPDDITYPSLTDNKRVKPCMHLGTNKVSRVIHRADFCYLKVLFQNQVFYLGIVWLAKHNMKYKCATARLREHQLAASVGQQ